MTRRNLIFVASIFTILLAMWVIHVTRPADEPVTPDTVARTPATAEAVSPEDPVITPTVAGSPEFSQERARVVAEIQALQAQLDQEQAQLQDQVLALQRLQAQRASLQQQDPSVYASQMGATQLQIQNFSDLLRGFQTSETRIHRRAEDLLNQQSSQAQWLREQLDDNIRLQEDLMRQTQNELMVWSSAPVNYVTERDARIQDLQLTLETQARQLDLMRQQRLLLSTEVAINSQDIRAQKNQELEALAAERAGIQEEISRLREQAFGIQEAQRQEVRTESSLGAQILQMQRSVEVQQDRLRALEETIQQRNQELNAVE